MLTAHSLIGSAVASLSMLAAAQAQPAYCPRILAGYLAAELLAPTASVVWDRDGAGPEAPLLVIAAGAYPESPTGAQDIIGWDGEKYVRMFTSDPPNVGFLQLFVHAGQLCGLSNANVLVTFNSSSWTNITPAFGVINEAISFNGEIVVCGTRQGTSEKGVFALRGGAWVQLGSSFNSDTTSLTIWNGQLVTAGTFTLPGITNVHAAYFDGANWQPLGSTSTVPVTLPITRVRALGNKVLVTNNNVIAIFDNGAWTRSSEGGQIYCATDTHAYVNWSSEPGIVKVYDGSSWVTLDTTSTQQLQQVKTIAEYQGRVFAMGEPKISSISNARVSALELAGSVWRPFGEGALGPVRSMAIVPDDGSVLTVCGMRSVNESSINYPAHPFARVWSGLSFKPAGPAFVGPPNINNPPRSVFYELTADPEFGILAGGYFFGDNGGVTLTAVARYVPDSGWGGFGSKLQKYKGTNNQLSVPRVYKVIRYQGELLAVGEFSLSTLNESSSIARYQDSKWVPVRPEMALPPGSRFRNAFVFDDKLFLVGTNIGASTSTFIYYDSNSWSTPNSALYSISPFCVHDDELYAVANNGLSVVRWDGSGWSAFGPELPNAVYCLGSFRGELYVGGVFGLRRGSGGTWGTLSAANTIGSPVNAIMEYNGELLIGGAFAASYSTFNRTTNFARYTADYIPWIVQQPRSRTGGCGETASFSVVTASKYGPTTCRWYKNDVALSDGPTASGSVISGAFTKKLSIANLRPEDAGSYVCNLIVSCGSVDSAPVTVAATCCPSDLNNDLVVDDIDFQFFRSAYDLTTCSSSAMPVGCQADLNGDGFVDDADFVLFLPAYDNLICP